MGTTQTRYYDTTSTPDAITGKRNWLTSLDDSTPLVSLSIPGTHNSCGRLGGHMYQCQSWTLRDQFRAGIRFLDIKCRHMYNSLVLYHGRVHQKKNFDDVIRCALSFLRENPREFIMMKIREEYEPLNISREFCQSLEACLTYHGRANFWTSNSIPNLGQARGKIIIISDQDYLGVPTLQDVNIVRYESFKHSYEQRWHNLQLHLQKASTHAQHENRLYITYFSGFTYISYPYTVAWRMNHYLYDYLCIVRNPKPYGVVVVDFPGVELIDCIISANNQDYRNGGSLRYSESYVSNASSL